MKTIALFEWNWMGHHPSYFLLFTRALTDLGYHVVGFCPKPDEATEGIRHHTGTAAFEFEEFKWLPTYPIPQPARARTFLTHFRNFREIHRRIAHWEKEHKQSIDIVFFACIYDSYFRHFRFVWRMHPRLWSGLYLHCRAFRKPGTEVPHTGLLPCPERFLKAKSLHSLAILDEGVNEQVTSLSGRPTLVFPDLTNNQLPQAPLVLVTKLTSLAQGRIIIGALGDLQFTKGCGDLAKIAHDESLRHLFFGFFGNIYLKTFDKEEQKLLFDLQSKVPNAFTYFFRIPDEREFNAIFQACDIIFAAYRNFPNSSNILTKAAIFEKPVIVSDGSLMAERVRKYRLGEVVPEGNLEEAKKAILLLSNDLDSWVAQNRPRWSDFREQHSYETLKKCFSALLKIRPAYNTAL